LDVEGRPDFRALVGGQSHSRVAMCFDLLEIDGRDLRALPLVTRRARLKAFLKRADDELLRYSNTLRMPRSCSPHSMSVVWRVRCQVRTEDGSRSNAMHGGPLTVIGARCSRRGAGKPEGLEAKVSGHYSPRNRTTTLVFVKKGDRHEKQLCSCPSCEPCTLQRGRCLRSINGCLPSGPEQ
jgi:hypothetical protein